MNSLQTNTNKTLLQLIRLALYGKEHDFAETVVLDWESIYEELEHQAISCIVVDLLKDKTYEIPEVLKEKWAARLSRNVIFYHKILYYQDQAVMALRENNIPVAVLKGVIAAMNYPTSEYRTMGDIDLLVSVENFERAKESLFRIGYQLSEGDDGTLDAQSKQKHIHLEKDGIVLELHINPFHIPTDNRANEILNAYMLQGLQSIQWISMEGYEIPVLPMLQNAIEFLVHVQDHFCSAGVGLRQVVDWMLFVEKYLPDKVYKEELQPILQQAGLERFACALTRMCQIYLGLPEDNVHWCEDVEEKLCADMMDYILAQGNFGHKNMNDNGARALARLNHPVEFFKSIQKIGLINYPRFRKNKALRCFAWVPQLGRYFKYVVSGKSSLAEDFKTGKKRGEMFEKLEMFSRKNS